MTKRKPPAGKEPFDPSEPHSPDLNTVLQAFDKATDDFEDKRTVVFPSESERRRLYFAAEKRWLKRWSKAGPCMYHGCTNTSISRSHTIPLSSSIKLIAEHGHLLTPGYKHGDVELVRVGVNDASTFPGFCEEHEALFADFETKRKMSSDEHFQLQAFRTLCREIYNKRYQKQKLEGTLEGYRQRRDEFITKRTKAASLFTQIKVRKVEFERDPLEAVAARELNYLTLDLADLNRLYDAILSDLRQNTQNTTMVVIDFGWRVPVCLSGIGILRYTAKRLNKRALCFLAIIPQDEGTKVIVGAETQHKHGVALLSLKGGTFGTLSLMERCMCRGSDHWFMTPSEWEAIPEPRKRAIRDAILNTFHSLGHSLPFSILDKVRLTMISTLEAQLSAKARKDKASKAAKQAINRQRAKLRYAGRRVMTG